MIFVAEVSVTTWADPPQPQPGHHRWQWADCTPWSRPFTPPWQVQVKKIPPVQLRSWWMWRTDDNSCEPCRVLIKWSSARSRSTSLQPTWDFFSHKVQIFKEKRQMTRKMSWIRDRWGVERLLTLTLLVGLFICQERPLPPLWFWIWNN